MRKFLGIAVIVGGVLLAVYVGIVVMFIGGITQVVDAFDTDPINSNGVAWGVARIVFASFTFGLILWGSVIAGIALIERNPYRRTRDTRTAKQIEQNWKKTIGD